MTIRHNLRGPNSKTSVGCRTSLPDRFLDFVETASGIGLAVCGLIMFLILAALICGAITAGPSLLTQLILWIGTLIPSAVQSVIQNPWLLITYPLALFITFLILWAPSALDARRNTGHERGRKVLTAADARRVAAHQWDQKNEPPSRRSRFK